MNKTTKKIVSVVGLMLAFAGWEHGFFETFQGNTPTPGLIIPAISESQRWWFYGGEEAFTILPTFLITGIAAMSVSLIIMVWSLFFVDRRYGPRVLGILFILLFLVGGGIAAQVIFAPVLYAAATRINKPLAWWDKILSVKSRRWLAKLWPWTLSGSVVCFLIGLEIAIFGYFPGMTDPDALLAVDWSFIFGGGLGLILISLISGFAADLQGRKKAI